jgi:hypothetical protein
MDRREFVKRAGVGSIGLGTLAVTPAALAGFRKGDGHQHFSLVAISTTSAAEATNHAMVLEGAGSFNVKTKHVDHQGGGNFVHIENFPTGLPGPLASGTWDVTGFVSYVRTTPVSDYGRIRSSILVVTVVLRPDAGGSLEGTLEVICNVGPAGISTGQPEGFRLNLPAAGFNFDTPNTGLTHISIPEGASSA